MATDSSDLDPGEDSSNSDLIRLHRIHMRRCGNTEGSITVRTVQLRACSRGFKKPFNEATREDIEKFLDGRDIGNRTRYTYVSHLHCFYVWMIDQGYATEDPTAKIIRPKRRRYLPRPAATDELAQAVEKADSQLRCWMLLAAFQGLRCQEIAGLRREDVLETEGVLHIVHGKGGHERVLPLHPEVYTALQRLPMPRTGWVFIRPGGGKFTPNQLSVVFRTGLRSLDVNATPHQLRHWFGTNLYAQTHDLRLTQEMLGHASPETTAVYTAFDRRAAVVGIGSLSLDARSIDVSDESDSPPEMGAIEPE